MRPVRGWLGASVALAILTTGAVAAESRRGGYADFLRRQEERGLEVAAYGSYSASRMLDRQSSTNGPAFAGFKGAPPLLWIDHACGTTPGSRASLDLAYFHDNLNACIATAERVIADPVRRGRGRVDPTSLARRAMDRAVALAGQPDFGIAPSEIGLTGLDTFLWLQSSPTPIEATASAGGVSVTAQAAPVDYLWDFGDGADLLTHHPGRPWTPQRPGNIAHLYETRGTYELEVTVVWSARWRTGSGPWQELGFFTTSATDEYQVRQVQSRLVSD